VIETDHFKVYKRKSLEQALMHLTNHMEQFSLAYVRALAACAGYQVVRPELDDGSIDGIIMSNNGRRARLEFQAKATSTITADGKDIAFQLPIKNYDDLRLDAVLPRILMVLCLPTTTPTDWYEWTPNHLLLKRDAYWVSLKGLPEINGQDSRVVHIPRSQIFNIESLKMLMEGGAS
jgi:hypothetical protein